MYGAVLHRAEKICRQGINPTVVRLRQNGGGQGFDPLSSFNPTVVRLRPSGEVSLCVPRPSFNPTVVRLRLKYIHVIP